MVPPLVTLLLAEPEIQYVARRIINLIVQKRLAILTNEMKVFFCKYNDPIYVKEMEKLESIIRLVTERNIEQVLFAFKEYATEVEFVRCSTKVNYVIQEAIVVIKDTFRKYINQYESIIATLCENLHTRTSPRRRYIMIWIIGKYAERIGSADGSWNRYGLFRRYDCPGAAVASHCYRKVCLPQLPSAFVVRSTGPETEDGQIGQQAGDPMDLLDMGDLTLREPSRLLRTLWQQRQLAQAWSTFVVALLLRLLQWQSAVLTATITGVASSVTRLRSIVSMSVSTQLVNAAVALSPILQEAIKNNLSGDVHYFELTFDDTNITKVCLKMDQ
ncbi:unnamed protein product [Peronospora effusa]|nr:unnamed protein product [Peronospora effusa]